MERRIIDPWTWQEEYGFHQGHEVVNATRALYLSGQTSLDGDGIPVCVGDMAGQIRQVIDNIEAVLAEADMSLADIVRVNIFTTDMDLFFEHADELERLREAGTRYTSTLVGVTRLAFPRVPRRDRGHRREVAVPAVGSLFGGQSW